MRRFRGVRSSAVLAAAAGVFAVVVAVAAGAGSAPRTGSEATKRPDVELTTRRPIRELAADGKGSR